MANKTAEIRARVEPRLKQESMKILKKLGLSESEGIRLLLKGLVLYRGIPFDLRVPNEETLQAMKESESGNTVGPFDSTDDLIKELES